MKYYTRYLVIFILLMSLSTHINAENKVYDATTITGYYQDIDTITSISTNQSKSASTAIILVPGLNSISRYKDLYEWRPFWDNWMKHPKQMRDKYKLFVFRYDGWDSLYTSANTVARGMREILSTETNIKDFILIGYSQGGIITRIISAEYPDLDAKISKVITLAAPHNGAFVTSPILSAQAIGRSGLIGIRNKLIADQAANRYKYAHKEQAWNDFDGLLPASSGYTVPPKSLNMPIPSDLSKFIVYGSIYKPWYPRTFEDHLKFFTNESIPRMMMKTTAGQLELNRELSRKKYPDETKAFRSNVGTNDTALQLSSAIWLKTCDGEEQPLVLKEKFPDNDYCPTLEKYRIFMGITHLHWRKPPTYPLKEHSRPDLGKKYLYDWIIEDIES